MIFKWKTFSGSREAAYTYSILSAGVTHEIGRRCRLGLLQSCGCSQAPRPSTVNEKWSWGGCGDNIEYGYRFSRDFIDVREKEEGFPKRSTDHGRSLMNRWNNEVGRRVSFFLSYSLLSKLYENYTIGFLLGFHLSLTKIFPFKPFIFQNHFFNFNSLHRRCKNSFLRLNFCIFYIFFQLLKRNTRPKCKCHGVSGSCNMKTCWMQLPTMRQMGAILLGKYHTARRIQVIINSIKIWPNFCQR